MAVVFGHSMTQSLAKNIFKKHQSTLFPQRNGPRLYLNKLVGQSRFKNCPGSGYFLLWSKDYMLETCMLSAEVRVHEHW